MPALETTELNQKAVLWAADGYDDHGEPKVDAGVEIDCRWENVTREVAGPGGTPIAIEAEVVVDRDVAIGSRMWLGELDDYASTETKLFTAAFEKTPDLKGRNYRRVVLLSRASDTLPTLNA